MKTIHIPGYSRSGRYYVMEYRGKKYLVPCAASYSEIASAIDEEIAAEAMAELVSFAILGTMMAVNATINFAKNRYHQFQVDRFSKRPTRRSQKVGQVAADGKWVPIT